MNGAMGRDEKPVAPDTMQPYPRPMAYPGFASFVAPARARSELWRTLAGFLVAMALYAAGAAAFLALAVATIPGISASSVTAGSTPLAVTVLLFHFITMAAAVALVTWGLHRRSPLDLIGDPRRLRPDFVAMLRLSALVAIGSLVVANVFVDIEWKLSLSLWLAFLPVALFGLLIQTGAEELVFRGYLLQQLGARFGVGLRAAWMIVPSAIFAALHVDPESQGSNVWAILVVIFIFALITADLTARTGSLGAAWALHFVTNCQAILILSLQGPLSGLSLGTVGMTASDPSVVPLLAMDVVAMLLVYWLWRQRFG